jgi:hypothetical protein
VEAEVHVEDARLARELARELERDIRRLGAAVGEEAGVERARRERGQFGAEPAFERAPLHLDHARAVALQPLDQPALQAVVVAADIEDAVAAEEVEVPLPFLVPEPRPLRPHEDLVEADELEHAGEAMIHVLRVAVVDDVARFFEEVRQGGGGGHGVAPRAGWGTG